MSCSTLETWSHIPEVLRAQPKEVIAELLEERCVKVGQGGTVWRAGGGFWLEDYGLSTIGDRENFSYIIPQEPRKERSHGEWIHESLKNGYITIVRQADAPNIPCDFNESKRKAAEVKVHNLFR